MGWAGKVGELPNYVFPLLTVPNFVNFLKYLIYLCDFLFHKKYVDNKKRTLDFKQTTFTFNN